MSKASQLIETNAFAERLRLALKGVGIRPSPTLVANEFNLRYWGKSITSHTARNWLLGKSIPMQDKLPVCWPTGSTSAPTTCISAPW